MRVPPVLLLIGSCVSLQFGAAFAAHLFPVTGSAGATVLRLGVAAVFLLALTRPAVRAWTRAQWRSALVLGVTLAGMNGFFYASIDRIPLGIAVTLEFLGPLTLAAVTSPRRRDLSFIGLALVGVVLLGVSGSHAGGGGLDVLGCVYALVAGAFWAAYILAAARLGTLVPGRGGLAVATAVAALVVLPIGAAGAGQVVVEPGLIPWVLATALLASVIPYSLEFVALRTLSPRVFGVLLSLEPAVAAVAGALLLAQALHPLAVLGILVVIAASAGATLSAPAPVSVDEAGPVPPEAPAPLPAPRRRRRPVRVLARARR
ncbi:DMT family transporter [Kineococcus gynurae]|uniref:DMT family transporter n=1 Tax=Kineococcus gynurae TaxID=452979 RepID=A0ABV5LQ92_9ACTN